MGFKTDTSFLRFLTMGALGVRQTMNHLRGLGFEPIELERYCTSNKIWMTKVKRLRLPDVLCVRTGLRIEVRAKSDLKIRMSDAPNNTERRWDGGLRDDDVAAFIAILEEGTGYRAADAPVFFTIGSLREAAGESKLGPPKSGSEGAERDRTWPAIIPSRDGIVRSVSDEKVTVEMSGNGGPARKQTYNLKGKRPYVEPGDVFKGGVSMLAAAPDRLADLGAFVRRTYDPLAGLRARNEVERYSAIKALSRREDLRTKALPLLEALLKTEREPRVALEAAAAVATLGSGAGQEYIERFLSSDARTDLQMEAVLILTELRSEFSVRELLRIANDSRFAGNEIRQAAVWGLGKAGLKVYEHLIPFVSDSDENVAMHAIVAFGDDTPAAVIRGLIGDLKMNDERKSPAASESLRMIASETVVKELIAAADSGGDWVIATLGRLPPRLVRSMLDDPNLHRRVAPMLLLSEGANWLASEDRLIDIAFLAKQTF